MKLLQKPSETFVRLNTMRRILARQPDDAETRELLAKTYVAMGVRGDEAERLREAVQKQRER